MKINPVLILDFGSQVTQLIARRIRECGFYSLIVPATLDFEKIKEHNPPAIILSGGPASVIDETQAIHADKRILEMGIPIFGICYGQQWMVHSLGGVVEAGQSREFGKSFIDINTQEALLPQAWEKGTKHQVWMSHGDHVAKLPKGFEVIAASSGAPFAFIGNRDKNFYAVQFHPEVVHTPDGAELIKGFLTQCAGLIPNWSVHGFKEQAIGQIRKQVGTGKVICGLSGGVDSSVVARLLHEAIGDQLTCIFVDTGLLRLGEGEQVERLFKEHFKIRLVHVRAEQEFLSALSGVSDPEQKRKIIGGLFIDIFEREANKIGDVDYLAQGTLYPDVIESVAVHGDAAVTIKSHHNVGGLPERMKLKLVEPVRMLFKDEVRALGRELGLDEAFIKRHPFPGPGLAIRIPGEITKEKCDILRKADAVYLDALHKAGLYDAIWQAFAVLLPVQTVGVMGDGRSYEYVCGLRAVTSVDGMTAEAYPFDAHFLTDVATRIINEVHGVNRVVYDITSKPPATIEWE